MLTSVSFGRLIVDPADSYKSPVRLSLRLRFDKEQWLDRYRTGDFSMTALTWHDIDVREYGDSVVTIGSQLQGVAIDPLRQQLADRTEPVVTRTFAEIERLLGATLPDPARRYPPWWANEEAGTHVHARAWLDAGRRTANVDLDAGKVDFVR
jgi:hypothetical protein